MDEFDRLVLLNAEEKYSFIKPLEERVTKKIEHRINIMENRIGNIEKYIENRMDNIEKYIENRLDYIIELLKSNSK